MHTLSSNAKARRRLSEKQLAARRANAQKSTGPKTPEGKSRSSQNALKHGFFAQTALLFYEDPQEFVALRDAYLAEHAPKGPTETHFVMEMANAQFRLRRLRGIEADLIQTLITRDLPSRGLSTGEVQAQALRALADSSHVLQLLQRYESMLQRQYERALRMLWQLRDRCQAQPPAAARQQPAAPSPETRHLLQALEALILAPAPSEPSPQTPILRNEPKPAPSPTNAATSLAPRGRPRPAMAPKGETTLPPPANPLHRDPACDPIRALPPRPPSARSPTRSMTAACPGSGSASASELRRAARPPRKGGRAALLDLAAADGIP